jgi:hypothetical protein
MDLGILGGIALIVAWGIAFFAFEPPGWVHLLLSVGVFVVIARVVMRGDPRKARLPDQDESPRAK